MWFNLGMTTTQIPNISTARYRAMLDGLVEDYTTMGLPVAKFSRMLRIAQIVAKRSGTTRDALLAQLGVEPR